MVSVSPERGNRMDRYEVVIHNLQNNTYTVVVTEVSLEEAIGQLKWCLTKGEHKTINEICIREV